MRIKEKLPWSIDSPSIHLVQPSDRVPMIHEVVSRQPSISEDDTILFTLSHQEWKPPKPLKKENGNHNGVETDKTKAKECALKCGYISPTIHWQFQPRRSSSFDLRIGQNQPSEERCNGKTSSGRKQTVHKTNSDSTSMKSNGYYSTTPMRTESSQEEDKRKSFADFNDILKELQMDVCSRTNSETESCGAKTPSSERKYETRSCETITRGNSLDSTDSNEVFYDIELNTENPEDDDAVKVPVRKSFSEETFEQSRKLAVQQKRNEMLKNEARRLRTISSDSCDDWCEEMWQKIHPRDTRRVSQMVDELLLEIYGAKTCMLARRRSCMGRLRHSSVKEEESSEWQEGSGVDDYTTPSEEWRRKMLQKKDICELQELLKSLQTEIKRFGSRLVRHLKRRDCFAAKRELHCDWITAYLQANSEKRSEDTRTRFSVTPGLGDSGFTQWVSGMRMVARLPEGIPQQFRKTLWLNLAEKHLASRGVNWEEVEEFCFNEYTNPDDEELGVQIVKDVHRTGCSLFCGTSGQHNQAVLKRVLLAYARWNKAVGYCQGFNMLAALILQVMDKSEVDSVKVMIFLIEGVLPESYFANNLRGLSVDMAVFRDLLRLKLPSLSRHLEQLQSDSKDSGTSYEPPLTNVFTMQWFLTLFCNCLPQETVLRVWDLIFLEGNQILLCTALAIWNTLSDRIMSVESADEFYSIMGVLTREMLEFGLMDANNLIKAIVSINFPELGEMRERYLYNITPWTQSVSTVARRGLRLFYSDDDTDNEEEDEKIAIATAYGLFRSPKKKESVPSSITSPPKTVSNFGSHPDREKIAMDISALKKQYCKLRERQRQAHIILTAACGGQTLVGPTTSPAMNHLLLGKCALVNNKGRRLGPPQGAIPPPTKPKAPPVESKTGPKSGETLHWKDTAEAASKHSKQQSSGTKSPEQTSSPSSNNSSRRGSSSSSSTELCDDPQKLSDSEDQTNSLSECYVVPENLPEQDRTEAMPTSFGVNLQTELSTLAEQDVEESSTTDTPNKDLEVPKKDDYEIYRDTATKTRRKSSFKIDLQEMKELDRKLSLKISEIERASFEKRRSIIGISSSQGAIDSQVLFPFDRDYIKEEDSSRHRSSEVEENDSYFKEEEISRQRPSEIEDSYFCIKEEDLPKQQSNETEGACIKEGILLKQESHEMEDNYSYFKEEDLSRHHVSVEEEKSNSYNKEEDLTNVSIEMEDNYSYLSVEKEKSDCYNKEENLPESQSNEINVSYFHTEEDLPKDLSVETKETDSYIKEDEFVRQQSNDLEEIDSYLKKEDSPKHRLKEEKENITFFKENDFIETEVNDSDFNHAEHEAVTESKSSQNEDNDQISVHLLEEEKLLTSESLETNTISETDEMLEVSKMPYITETKDSISKADYTSAFLKDSVLKSDREEEIILKKKENIFKKLPGVGSSNSDTNQQEIHTRNNSDLKLFSISPQIEENVNSTVDEEVESISSTITSQPISTAEDRVSPSETGLKFTPKHQILNLELFKSPETFQVEKTQQDNEAMPDDTLHFGKSSLTTKSTLFESEYKASKPLTEDVSSVEVKHQAARRGSEIALSLILEENSQLLSKFQQSKKSSVFQDKEKNYEEDIPQTYNFCKKSECFNLSENSEDTLSGITEISESTLRRIDTHQVSNRETKGIPASSADDIQVFHWLSNENKFVQKDTVQDPTKESASKIKIDKENDIVEEDSVKVKDLTSVENATFESYKDSSVRQSRYKYDVGEKIKDILKGEDKFAKNFGIEREQTKSESLDSCLEEEQVSGESGLFVKGKDNFENKFKYGYVISESKFEDESGVLGNIQAKKEVKLEEIESSLLDKSTFMQKDEDKFDGSEFKFDSLTSKVKYNPASAKVVCKRQASLDYSPKTKPFGCSSERRTSLSLDSGTTLKEESRKSSTVESLGESSSSKFSNFKFYTPAISELGFKEKHAGDVPLSENLERTEKKICNTAEKENAGYSKRFDFLESTESCKDATGLSDSYNINVPSMVGKRLRNEDSYSDFKMSDRKSSSEIKTEKFYKSTLSFDIKSPEKEYKPRYSSLSPRRRIVTDSQTEQNYLSSPPLERYRSPSPSTSNFSSYSVTDEKLKASSFRLSALKAEKTIDCDKKDSDSKFGYDSLDVKLRLGSQMSKSNLESNSGTGEHKKSPSDTCSGSSPTSPTRFNPFPSRNLSRQPKELGVKLGLYQPPKSDKSPSKRFS